MRIVAGVSKGRRLVSPKDNRIRPTSDRVKEAVFNIIGFNVANSHVLDLFAGTGSLGLEALSRGAEFATFVDNNAKSIEILKQNIRLLGFEERSEVFMINASDAVTEFGRSNRTFDIIFIDPPYMENLYEITLSSIARYGIIKKRGLVIVEHLSAFCFSEMSHELTLIKNKRYGSTSISIFTKGDDNENSSIPGKF